MKKNVFVVPTYVHHFEYAYKLRDSFSKFNYNSDLLFVLSNSRECEIFEEGESKKCFLMDNFTRGADYRGIITIKKFQGLESAHSLGYEYAIVLDCETVFTKQFDALEASKYLSQTKKVYSSTTNHYVLIDVNKSASMFFDAEEQEKLRIITNDFREYFWFNNLAFYDLSFFDKFMNKMYKGDASQFYSKMSSAHFDHTIYIYYCLLYENYELVNLNKEIDLPMNPFCNFHLGLLESIGDRSTRELIDDTLKEKIIKKLNPFWLPFGTKITNENSFMLFHEDRA